MKELNYLKNRYEWREHTGILGLSVTQTPATRSVPHRVILFLAHLGKRAGLLSWKKSPLLPVLKWSSETTTAAGMFFSNFRNSPFLRDGVRGLGAGIVNVQGCAFGPGTCRHCPCSHSSHPE